MVFLVVYFNRIKEILKYLRKNYGENTFKLSKELLLKINSIFIGLYGLLTLATISVSEYFNFYPFDGMSMINVGLVRGFAEFIIGIIFIITARLAFDKQKKYVNILYPLCIFTALYLLLSGDSIFSLLPLIAMVIFANFTKDTLTRENFIYSIEEIFIDAIFGIFWIILYLKNMNNYRIIWEVPFLDKALYFALVFLATIIVFKLILAYMKKNKILLTRVDKDEFKTFMDKMGTSQSTSAGLSLLDDKYIYYYENDNTEKTVAFQYQIVNNKIIVMGEPFGKEEDIEKALASFIKECDKVSLNPIFYEVGEKFTLNLHDYGYDFMKFGENALIDLDKFSLAGRKKSTERNILNRFNRDGYRFEILEGPYDDKLLDTLHEISDKWLRGRNERGFSMGFFDKYYLSQSKLGLVYDSNDELTAFTNLMPSGDDSIVTIDLMRYDTDKNVNSMMDYLFLNLFIYAKDKGAKYFNLGMAPLANVGVYKSAYLSERIAYFIYKHADAFYSFKGLRNYKNKYATDWQARYTCFAKGNSILSSMLCLALVDKKKINFK